MPAVGGERLRRTSTTILLHRVRENIRVLKAYLSPGTKLMCVVKADAYGHGMLQVSRVAQEEGVDWLGVAIAEEGVLLRAQGIRLPILVLGPLNQQGMNAGAAAGLTLTLTEKDSVLMAEQAALLAGMTVGVHIKIDTGMNRVGVKTKRELLEVLEELGACPHVSLEGAFTHFADADNPDQRYTDLQLRRFKDFIALLPQGLLLHASATAASLHRRDAHFGMVRMGIGLYGYPPAGSPVRLQPCLRWEAEVTQVKRVETGESVSYGCTFTAENTCVIATLAVGYGDGYPRGLSGKGRALIRGSSCPVIGRVCMDQLMVDASAVPGLQPGDRAWLIGGDNEDFISAAELAELCETIPYEIVLAPKPRVPRRYVDGEEG